MMALRGLGQQPPCPTHGAVGDRNCVPCRLYSAWIFSFAFPEVPTFEDYAAGVQDCLNWIDGGFTPEQIAERMAEQRAEMRSRGVAA